MRTRVSLVGLLMCGTLTACTDAAPAPGTLKTLEPSITQSSPNSTANPDNVACSLLTADERTDMVGYSLNAEYPVRPGPGTEECVWVHSLKDPPRAAVRVTTLSTLAWARVVVPQMKVTIARPTTGKAVRAKLKDAMAEILTKAEKVPADVVCEAYILMAEARGAVRAEGRVFYATIGAMPAAFGTACGNGIMTIAGYGEFGLGPSLALNRGVAGLAEAARKRAAKAMGKTEAGPEDSDGASPGTEDTGEDDSSPSPEPSPSETSETDGDESDEEES